MTPFKRDDSAGERLDKLVRETVAKHPATPRPVRWDYILQVAMGDPSKMMPMVILASVMVSMSIAPMITNGAGHPRGRADGIELIFILIQLAMMCLGLCLLVYIPIHEFTTKRAMLRWGQIVASRVINIGTKKKIEPKLDLGQGAKWEASVQLEIYTTAGTLAESRVISDPWVQELETGAGLDILIEPKTYKILRVLGPIRS